jgi:glycopeptide antibiotics resistance protein
MAVQQYQKSNGESSNRANRFTKALLIVYLLVLFWILLLKLGVQFSYMGSRSVNLVPFSQALSSHGRIDLSEIILNVIIFIPLGVYACILFKRWTWINKLAFIFFISFLIECLQYILKVGAFDITDIITNSFGGIIGVLLFIAVERAFNNSGKTQKFINIIAATGTVIMILLLLLLKLNMLPIRYQ